MARVEDKVVTVVVVLVGAVVVDLLLASRHLVALVDNWGVICKVGRRVRAWWPLFSGSGVPFPFFARLVDVVRFFF